MGRIKKSFHGQSLRDFLIICWNTRLWGLGLSGPEPGEILTVVSQWKKINMLWGSGADSYSIFVWRAGESETIGNLGEIRRAATITEQTREIPA